MSGGAAMAADPYVPPLIAPSPVPAPTWSGVLGLYGGGGQIEDDDDPYRIFGLHGAANVPLGNHNLQFGGVGEMGIETDSDTYGGAGLEAHLYRRGVSHAYGVLGSVLFNQEDDDWNIHGVAGAEAAFYPGSGNLTLVGQGGYIFGIDSEGNDGIGHGWFARGVAQFFLTPNRKLQGEVAYLTGSESDDGDHVNLLAVGAEVEHKFASPLSLFASWDGVWGNNTTDDDTYTSHTFLAGVRVYFGQDTLLSNNRSGASWDTPDITRWNGIVGSND
jgi:hypothetical protein